MSSFSMSAWHFGAKHECLGIADTALAHYADVTFSLVDLVFFVNHYLTGGMTENWSRKHRNKEQRLYRFVIGKLDLFVSG